MSDLVELILPVCEGQGWRRQAAVFGKHPYDRTGGAMAEKDRAEKDGV